MKRMLFLLLATGTFMPVRELSKDEMPNHNERETDFPDIKFVVGEEVFQGSDSYAIMTKEMDVWVRRTGEYTFSIVSTPEEVGAMAD